MFLLIRSDPEVWPMGYVPFFDAFRDVEVLQHRMFVVLITAFAIFEWGVRTGRLRSQKAALVFPLLTAAGGALLLTHSHAIANVKDQLLIEVDAHAPGFGRHWRGLGAVVGIARGWAHGAHRRDGFGRSASCSAAWC